MFDQSVNLTPAICRHVHKVNAKDKHNLIIERSKFDIVLNDIICDCYYVQNLNHFQNVEFIEFVWKTESKFLVFPQYTALLITEHSVEK